LKIKRAKIPPLIAAFALNPEILAMPSTQVGAILRLLVHWFMTDCQPLPSTNQEMRAIARCHDVTWNKYRDDIVRVFGELQAFLMSEEARRQANYAHLTNMRDKGIATKKIRAYQKRIDSAVPIPEANSAPRLTVEARASRVSEPSPAPRGGFVDRQR
jgi:hypothetical protein